MARPIDLNEAKNLINNYKNYGTDRHFDLNTNMITGYIFKRHELIPLMGSTENDELIIMLSLDIAAAHLRLVLAKLISEKIQTNLMKIDTQNPSVIVLTIPDPAGKKRNGDEILLEHLMLDHTSHINREVTDTLWTTGIDLIRAYVVGHNDLNSLGLLDDVTPANSLDEFQLIPVTRSTDSARVSNGKPYLSFAFARVINGEVQAVAREYFSPCPEDCTDYYNYFY